MHAYRLDIYMKNETRTEELVFEVLKKSKEPLLISEIVQKVRKISDTHLVGNTPEKSLYSMLYRSEKKRLDNGERERFRKTKRGNQILLELNK